uniref:Uncharacterized protein n=1 Tax=Hyaloperonospora arabidopsidis (strain Emoy2) TaxID=559515 RepID=M4B4J0_HYAAE
MSTKRTILTMEQKRQCRCTSHTHQASNWLKYKTGSERSSAFESPQRQQNGFARHHPTRSLRRAGSTLEMCFSSV